MPSLWYYLRRAPSKLRKVYFPAAAERLHIGSGAVRLPGWVNVDNQRMAGVDRVVDVTYGLPFRDVRFIFAEHFLEHLAYAEAMYFLRECRRVLREDGVLRLSTPNLDWVLATHSGADRITDCFRLNRAFRGWGHQFLYNFEVLQATLLDAGFGEVARREYGESPIPELRGLEHHERNDDADGISHILIVEASGRAASRNNSTLDQSRDWYIRDTAVR
jgi:predicted SAM-dependent methyltransferase